MPFARLPFTSLVWTPGAHPLERKKLIDGCPVLLEFGPGFEDPNWCELDANSLTVDAVADKT